jgi:hypothetical protein
MTSLEYLSQIPTLEMQIASKLSDIQSLRDLAANPCGCITGMPRNPSPDPYKMQEIIARAADIEKDVDALVDELAELKHAITSILILMDNAIHKDLIRLRFLERKTWSVTAEALGFSRRHVIRIAPIALKSFEKFL